MKFFNMISNSNRNSNPMKMLNPDETFGTSQGGSFVMHETDQDGKRIVFQDLIGAQPTPSMKRKIGDSFYGKSAQALK
jgi:putative hemolysin